MAIWREGNLNTQQNRREQDGVVYYIRGVREVEGVRYERYAVQTHFVERGEDCMGILHRYLSPLCQPGDILALGEKVISMCQNNVVEKKDVKLGFWARFLSKFATRSQQGIGMDEPYKLQLAIDMKGLLLILWASLCGAVARLFGKRGTFYKIVGQDIAGIDGFYNNSKFEVYRNMAVLNPKNPDGLCAEMEEELGVACMVTDANDINVEILGRSPSLLDKPEVWLADLIRDNPAGQDDELTPFVIIRDLGENEAQPYVSPCEAQALPPESELQTQPESDPQAEPEPESQPESAELDTF